MLKSQGAARFVNTDLSKLQFTIDVAESFESAMGYAKLNKDFLLLLSGLNILDGVILDIFESELSKLKVLLESREGLYSILRLEEEIKEEEEDISESDKYYCNDEVGYLNNSSAYPIRINEKELESRIKNSRSIHHILHSFLLSGGNPNEPFFRKWFRNIQKEKLNQLKECRCNQCKYIIILYSRLNYSLILEFE